jgi:hypothetical protein
MASELKRQVNRILNSKTLSSLTIVLLIFLVQSAIYYDRKQAFYHVSVKVYPLDGACSIMLSLIFNVLGGFYA